MNAITIKENPKKAILQTVPDYIVYLHGEKFSDLYFNMTGYVGYLPYPTDREPGYGKLTIGEVKLSAYRREIKALNKEWEQYNK